MKLKSYFSVFRPSRHRAEIDAKARTLIASHGDQAYHLARNLARADRPLGAKKDATWTKVANRIAALGGHEIGLKGADRWPRP